MKLSITLFYSILFRLCWKRNDSFPKVSVRFTAKFKDKYYFLFPEKLTKQTIMNALVKTIPVTSRGFLKCKGTYSLTSVGICKHCNVW